MAARLRPFRPEDDAAVDDLVARAFGRREEADLLRALRRGAPGAFELVAEEAGRVTGHIAFSPVLPERLAPGVVAFGLGPMAVAPDCQHAGLGSALVRAGLAACAERGVGLVFVLGHPGYYPRFGFRPAAERGFRYRSPALDAAFFVHELVAGAGREGGGAVRYPDAFESG
jgi:putative acetyltransferase